MSAWETRRRVAGRRDGLVAGTNLPKQGQEHCEVDSEQTLSRCSEKDDCGERLHHGQSLKKSRVGRS